MSRLVLAATLGANYGIYGPAFELCENRPVKPGSEEYLDSEKYQIRVWPIDRRLQPARLIARVNQIRRENPALQSDGSLRFHPIDNDQLIAYSKMTRGPLEYHRGHRESGSSLQASRAGCELPFARIRLDPQPALSGARPAHRRALPVARAAKLRRIGSLRRFLRTFKC